MSASVPAWLFVTNLVLTVALGIVAVRVAWRQWETAHAKALLDVFDKRFELYEQLKAVLFDAYAGAAGAVGAPQLTNSDRVRMLFGPEVETFQAECRQTISALSLVQERIARGGVSPALLELERHHLDALSKRIEDIDSVFVPYLHIAIRNEPRPRREPLRSFLLGH